LTQAGDDRYLALQPYPEPDANLIDAELEQQFDLLIGTIRTIRNLRAEAEIKPAVKVTAILQTESDREQHILTAGQAYIKDLGKVETLTITTINDVAQVDVDASQAIAGVVGTVQVLIPLAGVVDIEAQRTKLERDLKRVEAEIQALSGRLGNPGFVNKAPADVVESSRATLAEAEKQAEILRDRLGKL